VFFFEIKLFASYLRHIDKFCFFNRSIVAFFRKKTLDNKVVKNYKSKFYSQLHSLFKIEKKIKKLNFKIELKLKLIFSSSGL